MLYPTWPPSDYDVKTGVSELKTGKIEVIFTPEAQAFFDAGGKLED